MQPEYELLHYSRQYQHYAHCPISMFLQVKCNNVGHKQGLQNIPQETDASEIRSESNASKDAYLAAYIATGITGTVILIFLTYFIVKRCIRSSRARAH
jgi:hypothetical protein